MNKDTKIARRTLCATMLGLGGGLLLPRRSFAARARGRKWPVKFANSDFYDSDGTFNVDAAKDAYLVMLKAAGYPGQVASILWTVSFNPAIDQRLGNARLGGVRLARTIEHYCDQFPGRELLADFRLSASVLCRRHETGVWYSRVNYSSIPFGVCLLHPRVPTSHVSPAPVRGPVCGRPATSRWFG